MIRKEESQKLKQIIGNRYVKSIKEKLIQNGFETKSSGFITNVFNGVYENLEIESAIYDVYLEKLSALKKLERRKNNVLNKKPKLAGSGLVK